VVPFVRVHHSINQSIADATQTALSFDSERWDPDGLHFTSSAALTGTVAKTNGSNALVGTGTSFTTELSVGQVIDVPGGAVERRVVTAITDNLNLTVNANYANTASGQTASRTNQPIVCRTAGRYEVGASIRFAANATGVRQLYLKKTTGATSTFISVNGAGAAGSGLVTIVSAATTFQLEPWDFVTVEVYQNSTGALNVDAAASYSPELYMIWQGPSV
jgi:hypothetical protein